MQVTITYEQALEKASPGLRGKIKHSVELLRKSERIALRYSDEGFAIGFSGGKDSQAAYHIAQLAGVKGFPFFSPTTVDPPEVIRFIRRKYPEVLFVKPKKSIYQVAKEMSCLPTMKIRWCCAAFKEGNFLNHVTITGVRKAESVRRSKRNEVEVTKRKYSGDLDGFDEWSERRIERIRKKMKHVNQDQFSDVTEESEIRCVGGKDKIMIMPIIDWTEKDVWEFLNDVVEVPHCELYDKGRQRIGCIMCPMSSYKNILEDIRLYPHVYMKWLKTIKEIREAMPELRSDLNGGGMEQSDCQQLNPPRNLFTHSRVSIVGESLCKERASQRDIQQKTASDKEIGGCGTLRPPLFIKPARGRAHNKYPRRIYNELVDFKEII